MKKPSFDEIVETAAEIERIEIESGLGHTDATRLRSLKRKLERMREQYDRSVS